MTMTSFAPEEFCWEGQVHRISRLPSNIGLEMRSLERNNNEIYRLSHDVITDDVDSDVSTAYCSSSSGDGFGGSCVTLYSMMLCCGLTLSQKSVRITSPLPTATRRACCFQVGDYSKISPSTTKGCCGTD